MSTSGTVHRKILCIIMALVMLLMASCKPEEKGTAYSVYFLNSQGDSLIEKKINIEEDDQRKVAEKMLEMMDSTSDKHTSVIKPANVTTPYVEFNSIYADVYFDSSYYSMEPHTEVLYRAAVVKELTQMENVLYVRFYVDGKDAVYADGSNIGSMSADDFVDASEGRLADVQWKTINLYYSNKSGDALVKKSKKMCYNKNVSIEKVVVEQLIKGTTESGCYQSVPTSTKLLSISVIDRICYVNFSQEFAMDMVNAKSNVTIYSVVNSLAGLEGIDGVRIFVNGSSSVMYRDVISLDTVFHMNNDIIENK